MGARWFRCQINMGFLGTNLIYNIHLMVLTFHALNFPVINLKLINNLIKLFINWR